MLENLRITNLKEIQSKTCYKNYLRHFLFLSCVLAAWCTLCMGENGQDSEKEDRRMTKQQNEDGYIRSLKQKNQSGESNAKKNGKAMKVKMDKPKYRVLFNKDCTDFFDKGGNTPEGVQHMVDEVAQGGADVMLVTPSADFFAEPHIDGLIGYAKVFHQSGTSWTVSSYASEAANFAMFIGSYEQMQDVAERIRKAAQDLGVKRIVVGECGHAWRVAYSFWNTLVGPFDFLDPNYPIPHHICEFTHDLIERGELQFDKSKNDHMTLTFHDSCNVARGSRMSEDPGGQFRLPREIIKAVCNNFVDMADETIHENTFCCGGGGGLLTDDLMELRVKGAKPRMEALKSVVEENGVTHMAAICAICKTQFAKVMPYYGFGMDSIVSVHQLVSNAIILDGAEDDDAAEGETEDE